MDATSERNTRPVAEEIASKDDRKKHNNATLGVVGQEFETTKSDMRVLPAVSMKQPTIPIFARDFRWTPHIFDSKKSSANSGVANISYDMLCPHGGPGGLVCCDSCTASYAKYLTKTVTDMETQKMQRAGDEVKELLDFTRQAKHRLTQTIRVARRKPVPIRCINSNLSVAHVETDNDNNNAGPSSALEAPPPPVVVQEVLPPVNVWTTAGPSMEFSEYMPTEEV